MKTVDSVSPELRKIEKEVDNFYKSNPLVELPFATAALSFLAFVENRVWEQASQKLTSQELETMGSNFVNELKVPMYWLFNACEPGGQIPHVNDRKVFTASKNLFRLGEKYQWFETAYTYASRGWVELELQKSTIQPKEEFFTDIEYQAYGRLIKAHESDEAFSLINLNDFHLLEEKIRNIVKVKGNRFLIGINPQIVDYAIKVMSPAYDKVFLLPSEWEFSRYTLNDFRKVFEAILAVAHIYWIARMVAIEKGCPNKAYLDSIYLLTPNELLRRVVRYSKVSDEKVLSIIDDLTYGNKSIRHPDPALQPLIKLNSECYAIMPQLWLNISPERNFTVLLNKLPCDRKIYRKLVNQKEYLMRQSFITSLPTEGFRFIEGSVKDLPDVDFAVINDAEKACLLLELKWFIAPAEFSEVVEKSEEIEKGIFQVLRLKQAFKNNYKPLLERLNIESSYRFEGVVVSQNWIGYANVQSPEVPVIRADHLIEKLKVTDTLHSTMDWLKNRKFLPIEGVHFEKYDITKTIGNWTVKWKTTRPLIQDAFFPL